MDSLDLEVTADEQFAQLRSLLAALRDDDLRGVVPELIRGQPAPGTLGVAEEVIRVAIDPKVIAGVAGVLTTWLTTRRRTVKLRLKRKGKELSLDASSPDDATKILEQIKGFLEEDAG
ncbi:effector-associated constant component EACC1 [Amycolatopsis plumensis]|uniref:Uncharacterized protein n=1 Tax=Amycolatopsis plumensis TaxID=236508 RepID=A0ABV5UB82_9PSEU